MGKPGMDSRTFLSRLIAPDVPHAGPLHRHVKHVGRFAIGQLLEMP